MELFNIGPLEILFILVIAIIVMGPERAGELASELGRLVAGWRRNMNMIRSELRERMAEETSPLKDVQGALSEVGKALEDALEQRPAQPDAPPAPDAPAPGKPTAKPEPPQGTRR